MQEVEKRVEGKRVLVILDSLHTPEHVLNELCFWQITSFVDALFKLSDSKPLLVGVKPAGGDYVARISILRPGHCSRLLGYEFEDMAYPRSKIESVFL